MLCSKKGLLRVPAAHGSRADSADSWERRCGCVWDMGWGELATANSPGLGRESGVIIKGPILASSKPLKQPTDNNSRALGLGFFPITEAFLTPQAYQGQSCQSQKRDEAENNLSSNFPRSEMPDLRHGVFMQHSLSTDHLQTMEKQEIHPASPHNPELYNSLSMTKITLEYCF